jgi:hypothetical protein
MSPVSLILANDAIAQVPNRARDQADYRSLRFVQDVFTYTASTGQGGTADSTLTVNVMAAGSTYLPGTPLTGGKGSDTFLCLKTRHMFR